MAAKKRSKKTPAPAKRSPAPRKPKRPVLGRLEARAAARKPRPKEGSQEPPAEKRGPGRPTVRTAKIEEEILDWIADGKPLREFCRLEGKPSHVTVHSWRKADPAFSKRFARAREIGADQIAEEILEIADTQEIGEVTEEGETPGENGGPWSKVRREDMLGHRKLRIEARLKLLAKWFPKLYGDKLDVKHEGTLSFDDMVRKAMGLPTDEGGGTEKP